MNKNRMYKNYYRNQVIGKLKIATTIWVLFISLISLPQSVFSQTLLTSRNALEQINNKRLKIGDSVPDITISKIVNYKSDSVKISNFNGKILVLDFWATWCGSCIEHFPQMFALQKKLPKDLQFLLVNCKSTKDDLPKIQDFFEKRKQYYKFPCAVLDTNLKNLFPHWTIPHYVWIKDNVVVAITDFEDITETNIENMHNRKNTTLPEKTFLPFDINKPLFVNGNGGDLIPPIYQSFFAAYKRGLEGYIGLVSDDNKLVYRIDVLNQSRIALIKYCFPQLSNVLPDRFLFKVGNPLEFSSDSTSERWRSNNCFIYESSFPAVSKIKALKLMQSDIERYLKIRVDSVDQDVSCLVLSISDTTKFKRAKFGTKVESNVNEHTGGPTFFSNYNFRQISINIERVLRVPIIDETGYQQEVNIILPNDLNNEKLLVKSFLDQGIKVKKENRKMTFWVIESTESESRYTSNL